MSFQKAECLQTPQVHHNMQACHSRMRRYVPTSSLTDYTFEELCSKVLIVWEAKMWDNSYLKQLMHILSCCASKNSCSQESSRFIHIAKSHQQTRVDAAWLPSILSRLHSCGYCRSVCETEPQDYPNQRLTQEAACYIIQRHLLRVIAQIVQDKMLHSERSLRNGKESVPSLALGCPKHWTYRIKALHTQAEMVHYRSKPDRVYETDKMDETRGDGNLERSWEWNLAAP